MGVAGEISLDSEPLQLHQNVQVFGGSSHISHRTFKHKDNHNLKTSLSHTPQFYFLLVWQARGLTYDIHEVVTFLTKSDVGWDTICSKGGRFQIQGSVSTDRETGLTSKKEGTLKFLISIEVEGSEVPCRLRLRGVDVMEGLTLFLGGFSSEDKTKDFGLAALFLSAGDFLLLSVLSVRLSPISELLGITWMCEILIITLFVILMVVLLAVVLITVEFMTRRRVHRRNRVCNSRPYNTYVLANLKEGF